MSGFWATSSGTNHIDFNGGSIGAAGTGAHSIAVLWQSAALGSTNTGLVNLLNGATQVRDLIDDAGSVFGAGDFSSGFSGGGVVNSTWYVTGISKAAGSNTYRCHHGPWTGTGTTLAHGVATGAATHGDGSAIDVIQVGNGDDVGQGAIAVVAIWTSVIADAAFDALNATGLSAWVAQAPGALITLNNWNGSTGAVDVVGTASFTGLVGTVTSVADPPGFSFGLSGGGSPEANWPQKLPEHILLQALAGQQKISDPPPSTTTNVPATDADATADGQNAAIDIQVNATDADATATGQDASITATATPADADATAAAFDATVSTVTAANAPAADADATATAQDAAIGIQVNAIDADATAAAFDATVSTVTAANAPAADADATATAQDAAIDVKVNAVDASGTAAAFAPTGSVGALALDADASATAQDAVVALAVGTAVATTTAAAFDATVVTGVPGSASAAPALATTSAFDAAVCIGVSRPFTGITAYPTAMAARPGTGTTTYATAMTPRPDTGETEGPC